MEIERKFLIDDLPEDLLDHPCKEYEQGYLSTTPVVRVRREQDEYVLTYKSGGLMAREEYNLPLNADSFGRLIKKSDGRIIKKTRYFIPDKDGLTIELDVFHGDLAPLVMAEVEFGSEEEAKAYEPPAWFGREVTFESAYHNSVMSKEGLPKDLTEGSVAAKKGTLMDTVSYDESDDSLVIIDQTRLPGEIKLLHLYDTEEIKEAIYALKVRGAPAIGVAAALGLYAVARHLPQSDHRTFYDEVKKASRIICQARPTAVNLSWALKRMERAIDRTETDLTGNEDDALKNERLLAAMKKEAFAIRDEDIDVCRRLGEYGEPLIRDGFGILTHCNAGHLATTRYGTATSPMYLAHEKEKRIHVYCDETRPLLQGARLTAFELSMAGIDTTLQCDNMSASLLRSKKVDIIFVGADRIAANGDTANKIGTSLLALAAKRYGIPFYVVAPCSTIDIATQTGEDIEIEQRDGSEVTELWYEQRMAPEQIGVYNPAFDVTEHDLITGIITERGIIRAPFDEGIARIMRQTDETDD